MYRITLILILFLFIPDLYIHLVYVVKRTRNIFWRFLYWLPTIILTIIYVYYIYLTGDNAMSNHAQSIGHLAVAILFFAAPKLVFMLCSLLGILVRGLGRCLSQICYHTPFRSPRKPFIVHRAPFTILGLILAVISAGNILYGAYIGTSHFEVKNAEFYSEKLPEGFDGYRIVQLSDLHTGSWKGKEEQIKRLVEMVNAQKADLIVFTGDLVNQQSHELDDFRTILSNLSAPDGVFSILGNHDYGTYYRWSNPEEEKNNLDYLKQQQADMGWILLNNEHAILHHKGDSIALIGVENDGEPPFSQYADLPKAKQGTDGMFSILLSHNPTHWRREVLPTTSIDLMLAGHTHAMQMAMFGYSLASLKYPEWGGMYYEGKRALYVNIGIGYVGLPFRFGAWPEITVLTLKKRQ